MLESIISIFLLVSLAISVILTAVSLPLGSKIPNPRQSAIRRHISTITFVVGIVFFGVFVYGYVNAQAQQDTLDHIDFDKLFDKKNEKPKIDYSIYYDLMSAFSSESKTRGIDCSQVIGEPNGVWNIVGTIRIGGLTLSQSVIGTHAISVAGNDVATLISQKCGARSASFN